MSEISVELSTDTSFISNIIEANGSNSNEKEKAIHSCRKILNLEPFDATYIKPVDFYEQVPPGSHIAYKTDTKVLGENIWHHAIYDGNKKVIHMVENGGGICITSVIEFMAKANQQCVIVQYENDNVEMQQSTRIVANYLLKSLGSNVLYQIHKFNCEHFAAVCRTGKWRASTNYLIHQMCCSFYFPVSSSRKNLSCMLRNRLY